MAFSDGRVANRYVKDFGWEMADEAVSRRPPISLDTIVALTHMYTYAESFCPSFKGRFFVAPCQNHSVPIRFLHRCTGAGCAMADKSGGMRV